MIIKKQKTNTAPIKKAGKVLNNIKNKAANKLNSIDPKIVDRAGKIGARVVGVGIAAGLGYGGYKAYQHFKNKKKDDNTKG